MRRFVLSSGRVVVLYDEDRSTWTGNVVRMPPGGKSYGPWRTLWLVDEHTAPREFAEVGWPMWVLP